MSKSACVEKMPCPDCKSSDSLQAYLNVDDALGIEWYTSFCHGECHEQKGNPYEEGMGPKVHVKTKSERLEEAKDILGCRRFAPKNGYRSIPAKQFLQWGLRLLLSEFDGKTPYAIGFPLSDYGDLSGWKARTLKGGDNFSIGITNDVDMFGLERAIKIGGDTIWITEGEFDAIALDFCLTEQGGKPKYPVVSLNHGGGSLDMNFARVDDRVPDKFKNVVLVLDNDKVGHIAEQAACYNWSETYNLYLVNKPVGCKDANDAVKAGLTKEMGRLALNFKDRPCQEMKIIVKH